MFAKNNFFMKLKKSDLTKKIAGLLLFSLVFSTCSLAQAATSGKEFFVAFGRNGSESAVNADKNVELMLRITAPADTKVSLSFMENPSLNVTFYVSAGTIYDHHLTRSQALASYSGKQTTNLTNKKSIRVTADHPVTLVAMNSANHSVEATLVLPVESWGTEYYNTGIPYYSGTADNCNGYILIAKEDNTTVAQSANIANPTTLTLNAGEMYHYYNSSENTLGAHIVADKPVAFFNSNTMGEIKTDGVSLYNYNFEQLVPVNQWGKAFIAPASDLNAGFFRIYPKEIPTTVTLRFSDNTTKVITIDNPSFYYRHLDVIIDQANNPSAKACYITSDKPVSVCAFTKTATSGSSMSQPAMAWLPSLEQRTGSVMASPLDFDGKHVYMKMDHYLTIITPTAGKAKTTLSPDGTPPQPVENVPGFDWVADDVGGSGYSFGTYYFGESYPFKGDYLNTTVFVDNPDGILALAYGRGSYTNYFYAVGSSYRDLTDCPNEGAAVIWTPNAAAESEKYNWYNSANWTPAVVPTACHNVYIPGNSEYYPKLDKNAECNTVYFMQGAELGRPDLLTYNKACVQMNIGLKQSEQITGKDDKDLVLKSASTADRMLYSAAVSAAPLERERWYMLSSPLKGVLTGDLGFGGFPLTYLKKFGPIAKDDKDYPVGTWTTTYTSMTEPVALNTTDGFVFYMYGYTEGGDASCNRGCEESGFFGMINESDFMPQRNGQDYGIGKTNGILELPFFADTTNLYAHRTQVYDGQQSTFYHFNSGITNLSNFGKLSGTTESISRSDSSYRFAPENYVDGAWIFPKQMYHPATGLIDGVDFLVGNPYMSSIDMAAFYAGNSASIEPSYKLWNGTSFNSYSMDTETGGVVSTASDNSVYVSPLQGFFLTCKQGGGAVLFDVEKISTVRPAKTKFNLRSAPEASEENILRIKAENSDAVSHTLIGYREGASAGFIHEEDVRKLFSPQNNVPEIYSLAGDTPVDINFINDDRDIIIPLGVKTGKCETVRLTFTGMDNYHKTSKIELFDALENKTIDLTGKASFTCSFSHAGKGVSNRRFSLRIGKSMTSLPDFNHSGDSLKIYGDSNGIYVLSSEPVKKLEIYDLQGRKHYESVSDVRYYPLRGNWSKAAMIVKAITNNQVKTVKVN